MKRIGFWLSVFVIFMCVACNENTQKTQAALAEDAPKVFLAKVTGVADGDTLWVTPNTGTQDKIKIRVLHIDTPESKQRDGALATAALKKKARVGATIKVQSFGFGKYGRMLAVLYPYDNPQDGIESSFNYQMVAEGFAWADRHYSPVKSFLNAEKNAREKALGIWAYQKQGRVIPPWFFRRGITETCLDALLQTPVDSHYKTEPKTNERFTQRWLYIVVRGSEKLDIHFAPFRTNQSNSFDTGEELATQLNIKPWMILGGGLYKPNQQKVTVYQDWFSPYSEGDLILTALVMQGWIQQHKSFVGEKTEMDLSGTEWPISFAVPFFQDLE